jgi:hypothetical protein
MMRSLASPALAAVLFLASAFPAAAQTVYRPVENGVTSFSDTPPEEGTAEVIEVNVPPAAEDALLERRLAQLRETTDRMASDRREREKQRAELRALGRRDSEPTAAAPVAPTTAWAGAYWPAWGRSPVLRHPPVGLRPPHKPHPHYPLRPPLRPPAGWSVMQPGNAQLMRPVVSRGGARVTGTRN